MYLFRKTGDIDLVYRAYPLYHGNWNDIVHCQQIPDVDLRFWQETPVSSSDNKAKTKSTKHDKQSSGS